MEELKRILEYTGIDVEQLVNDYVETLHNNNNPFATREAAIMTLKEWAKAKEWLIHQVMAMPGYNGNLQSVGMIEVPYERTSSDTYQSVTSIWRDVFNSGGKLLSKVDDDGKKIEDYIKSELAELPVKININDITKYNGRERTSFTKFDNSGFTRKSLKNKDDAYILTRMFFSYTDTRLTNEMASDINEVNPDMRAAGGMKTTRALGKVMKLYGVEDKTPGSAYGREFISKYCEIMKEGGLRMLYVVSVNPIDYLKMSIGEFTSCHNINGGGWRSGTISYMLDKVTMITYTVRPGQEITSETTGEVFTPKNRPELFKKVHRNVMHWDDKHRLIQSRVYPQALDGTTDMYRVFRHEAQARISKANGWDTETWTNRKRKYMEFTEAGEGRTNYDDWSYEYMGGNLSTPGHAGDPYSTEKIVIGTYPMCVICGAKHTRSGYLKCARH